MAERHRTEILTKLPPVQAVKTGLQQYKVACSCGYVSRWFDWLADVNDDEAEHVRLMSHVN